LAPGAHAGKARSVPARGPACREVVIATRTALVGGGAAGIGYATAERLALAGHQVVLAGRTAASLDAAAARLRADTDAAVGTHVHDLADRGAAEGAAHAVESRYGPLDVLVLNAGGPPPGRILEVDGKRWQEAFELLLLGPVSLARAVLAGMAERGFGRVVFVTSNATRQPQPDLATSVVLRSAVTAAAKLLSREFAAEGVTVNCVAPGATATGRRHEVLANRARATGTSLADLDAADTATIPAARAGEPAEIGAVVAFLASAAASYVNGTVLTVDGGRTETI
jgi:3-oxoacyl-[acyl-carrier protein] reductase